MEARNLEKRLIRQTADIGVAERTVEEWKQNLDDTVIRAPFAGVVTSKNAQPGEMISPMSVGGFTRTGICTVVDMTSLEVEVDVNESYIHRVQPGQKVESVLDAYPDWRIPSKVIAIIPTADRQKATVKVRVGFDKLDPRILPDMGVKVAFQGEEKESAKGGQGAVVLPKAAVNKIDGHDVVWVVKDGRAERRAVTVAESGSDECTISGGLRDGERVAVNAPPGLTDGSRVTEKGS
jgi:RND family efflux transporter MFP subunit